MRDIFSKRTNVEEYIIQNPGSLISNPFLIYIYLTSHSNEPVYLNPRPTPTSSGRVIYLGHVKMPLVDHYSQEENLFIQIS